MELGAGSWLWWWQERDGEPQTLLGGSSRSVVGLSKRELCLSCEHPVPPLFPWKRKVLVARGSWDQICGVDTELVSRGGVGSWFPVGESFAHPRVAVHPSQGLQVLGTWELWPRCSEVL